MTLIVLEIRVPNVEAIHSEAALWHALGQLAPRMLTYLLSFMTLGIFWLGQQTQLSYLERSDRTLSWIHFLFLALVALLPFSTSLLAEFVTFRTALLVYWFNILLMGLALLWSWTTARRSGLVKADAPPELSKVTVRRIVSAQLLYAVGASLCLVNTAWSIGFILLVQLIYTFTPRFGLFFQM